MHRLEIVDPDRPERAGAHETSAKRQVSRIVQNLPDDSSFDDILRELAHHRMILRGLADAEAERLIGHADVLKRSRTWIR